MDSGQITAVVIVAIIMLGSIIKASFRGPRHRFVVSDQQTQAENRRLHSEVEALKDRIKVLERIAVEKENSLTREIESLRDR
jgi:uncharacterized protein YlxW (UPF0749 family)